MFENFTVRLCRDRFDHSLRHAFLLQPKLKAQIIKAVHGENIHESNDYHTDAR